MIVDAHVHLWDVQNGRVDGRSVTAKQNGISDFGGAVRQMMPPYMLDGRNTVDMLRSNMDFACVNAAVVTQEEIDGNQDAYLMSVRAAHPEQFRVCSLLEEGKPVRTDGVDGVKICAGRLNNPDLTQYMPLYHELEQRNLFLSLDLADGDAQCGMLREIIAECPRLRIAIGHFGMVTRPNWTEQIRLAQHPNVRIESGGITWLFHSEFYPYPSAVRAILEAADICGMEKLMWGSDYPRTMTAITYAMSLDFVRNSAELSDAQKALFLGENARDFYGFSPMPPIVRRIHMAE